MDKREDRLPLFSVGDTVQGFGLHNAGRHYTVVAVGKTRGRICLADMVGRVKWTFSTYYRLV